MSNDLLRAVFERSRTIGNARLVLLALADMADDAGECFPAIKTLASRAGVGVQSTRLLLHAFERKGVVVTTRRGADYRQTSNRYRVVAERIGQDAITKADMDALRPPAHRRSNIFKRLSPVNGQQPALLTGQQGSPPINGATGGPCWPANSHPPVNGATDEPPEITLNEPIEAPLFVEPAEIGDQGGAGAPDEPNAQSTRKLTPQQAMVQALANVMEVDEYLEGARLGKLASALRKGRYTPAVIRAAYSRDGPYYREDWRGQKGQAPNERAIRETVMKFAAQAAQENRIVIEKDGGTYV